MSKQRLAESQEKTQHRIARRESRPDSAQSFHGDLHSPILQLQRMLGNRNVAKLIQAKRLTPEGKIIGLQRKLTVSAADDQYEQEADRVARQVMNTPNAVVSHSVQRQPETEEEETEPIQAKSAAALTENFEAGADVETQVSQSKGHGSPLPDPVRAYMEPRFGVDFSHVHVHTGNDALQMNQALGAQAFTHGSDIYFGPGHSPTNLELTAHELTHVVQQTGEVPLQTKKQEQPVAPLALRHLSNGVVLRAPKASTPCPTCAVNQEEMAQRQTHQEGGAPSERGKEPLNFLSTADIVVGNVRALPAGRGEDICQRQDDHASAQRQPAPGGRRPRDGGHPWLELQRAAGNAAVSHLISRAERVGRERPSAATATATGSGSGTANPMVVMRWASLGEVGWDTFAGRVRRSVMVGTEAEWREKLKNMDDEDEWDFARGFLEVANDPTIVGRRRHPMGWDNYFNTIRRAPSDEEVMRFMRALYSTGEDLDLPNTVAEGGPFLRYMQKEFGDLIARYQGRVLQELATRGEAISSTNVRAVAEQGGAPIRTNMLINAGATAMKGIDLIKTANGLPQATPAERRPREVARRNAFETIRNAGRTIKAVLVEHDAEIAARQAVIGMIFESVWEAIPAGGALASGAKELLKLGLSRAFQSLAGNDEPRKQAELIQLEFVRTVNLLVPEHLDANDANGAINGFEAVWQ